MHHRRRRYCVVPIEQGALAPHLDGWWWWWCLRCMYPGILDSPPIPPPPSTLLFSAAESHLTPVPSPPILFRALLSVRLALLQKVPRPFLWLLPSSCITVLKALVGSLATGRTLRAYNAWLVPTLPWTYLRLRKISNPCFPKDRSQSLELPAT